MIIIKKFDEVLTGEKSIADLKEAGINGTLFWAYSEAKEAGNELIDFNEVIWDSDVEEIANFFKEENITEFTISSRFSGLIPTLALFEKNGFKVSGITEVKARHIDWKTGSREIMPAIKMIAG